MSGISFPAVGPSWAVRVSEGGFGRRLGGADMIWLGLATQFVLDDETVSAPDLIAQVVEEFEHGESGVRGSVIRDREPDRLKARVVLLGHELAVFRCRARRSARSVASLRR